MKYTHYYINSIGGIVKCSISNDHRIFNDVPFSSTFRIKNDEILVENENGCRVILKFKHVFSI